MTMPTSTAVTARRFGRTPAVSWLMLPAVLFLAVVYLTPLTDLIRLSFTGPSLWEHYARVFATPLYRDSLVRTLNIAATVSLCCLLLGYPVALLLIRVQGRLKVALMVAVVLPYFIAILIRTYAWMVVLGIRGPLNKLLMLIGVIDEPMRMLFGRGAVLLGMTAVLLPLMVLTIYNSLAKIDPNLSRAALASGASPTVAFWRVTFPLTIPGVAAGVLLVFVSALGFFITPTLLGGPGDQMFAMHITQQADFLGSAGFLQALAVFLLSVTTVVVAIAIRFLGLEFIWGGEKIDPSRTQSNSVRLQKTKTNQRSIGALLAEYVGWPILRLLNRLPGKLSAYVTSSLAVAVLAMLVAPIVIVAILSFSSASFLTFPPPSFSVRWYHAFFSDPDWIGAFFTSVSIASLSALFSVVLGTGAAMGIVRGTIPGKSALITLLVSPLIVPPVVLGLSLYGFFLQAGLVGTPLGIAAAHAIGGIPLVIIIISASLQLVDRRLEQAAAVHGAPPYRVFLLVTIPGILPGLGAAAFFAFLHSFDELVLSLFLSGPSIKTLPLKLWGDINYQLNPVLAVVSTLEVILVTVGLVLASPLVSARKKSGSI